MLEIVEIGIIVSLILIIVLTLFLIFEVMEDLSERKKPHGKDHWFEPGGHLYESE